LNHGPLIILGASARAAAQSAIRAGFEPYPIDLFADWDLQPLNPVQIERYPAEFLTALAAAPDAPWMYTGSLENYPRLIARLARLRPLQGNNAEVLTKVRDPRWLAELLADSPVKFPETVVLERGQGSGVGRQESQLTGNWLLKPLRSAAGMGIRRVRRGETFSPRSKPHALQRAVIGQSISVAFSVIQGEVSWLGASEQWIGKEWAAPQEFQYAGSLAPLALSAAEEAALLQVATQIATAANLRGLCGLDLIRNEQGLWLIEVNPRYTASMELYELLSTRCLIAEQCGMQIPTRQEYCPPETSPARYEAKLIVYAEQPGSCGPELHRVLGELDRISYSDVPRLKTEFERGNPICTLSTGNRLQAGISPAELRDQLLTAAAVVRAALDPARSGD
jgi:predicted ATP-grasp superfamily ATP-dependent carboligase